MLQTTTVANKKD